MYTYGSITKDQSGWGFTVKQGSTINNEASAAYTVSTSSLILKLEASTHAVYWIASRGNIPPCHPPHRFNELAAKSKKWNEKPKQARVNVWESNGGKWLASWKMLLRSLTKKAKDITPSVAWRTEAGKRKLSSINR